LPTGIEVKLGTLVEPMSHACHDVRSSRFQAGEKSVNLGGVSICQFFTVVSKTAGAEVLITKPMRGVVHLQMNLVLNWQSI